MGTTEATGAWEQLQRDVEAWDLEDAEVARALLGRVDEAPPLHGSDDKLAPLLRELRALKGDKRRLLDRLADFDSADPPSRHALRLLARGTDLEFPWAAKGDANALRSFFARPARSGAAAGVLTDESIRRLSGKLSRAAVAVAPHAGSIAFLSRCMRLKPREQWIPAAVSIAAALADGDDPDLAALGLEKAYEKPDASGYSTRHLFTLATLVSGARGQKYAGRDALEWLGAKGRGVAPDPFNLSATALACADLAARRPDLAARLADVAASALELSLQKFGTQLSYQHADAARRMIEVFGDVDVAWRMLLREVPSHALEAMCERLFDAHRALLWLRERGDAEREAQLLAGPLACGPNIVRATRFHGGSEASRREATEWQPQLAEALRALAPDRWNAEPDASRATRIVTALVLVRADLVTSLDWPTVVAACGAEWLEASSGTVGQRAWVDLVELASRRDALFRYLLHHGDLDGVRVRKPANATSDKPAAKGGDKAAQASQRAPDSKAKPAKSAAFANDLFPPRETAGLARLLRARWKSRLLNEGDEARVEVGLNRYLTDQCALHLVRRLAVADAAEAGQTLLAALAADAPQLSASGVTQKALEDKLWQKVRDELPKELQGEPLPAALERLIELEKTRGPGREDAEAEGYAFVLGLFPGLNDVAKKTANVWEAIARARASAPALDGTKSLAGPETVRLWLRGHLVVVADRLAETSAAIETALGGETLPDHALRAPDRDAVLAAANDEVVAIDHPVLDRGSLERWRAAIASLRRLAEPLPWFVEAALDELLNRLAYWLDAAEQNERHRALLLERVEATIQDEDEEQLDRVLREARETNLADETSTSHFDLLDGPSLRAVCNFWLRRLRFDQARMLPKSSRTSPWTYYGPLVLAIFGAPLTTIQTNYLWEALIGTKDQTEPPSPFTNPRYLVVNLVFLAVCGQGLYQDLRRRLAGLSFVAIVGRAWRPLSVLFGVNYLLALITLWVVRAPDKPALPFLETTLLWGTLSLYLGLFLGLFAQGARIDREDVSDD
jgi:hypothetical protein